MCDLSTQEADTGGSQCHGLPGLNSKFQASLYIVRACFNSAPFFTEKETERQVGGGRERGREGRREGGRKEGKEKRRKEAE